MGSLGERMMEEETEDHPDEDTGETSRLSQTRGKSLWSRVEEEQDLQRL